MNKKKSRGTTATQARLKFFGFPQDVNTLLSDLPPKPYRASNRGDFDPVRDLPRASIIIYETQVSLLADQLNDHWNQFKSKFSGYEDQIFNLGRDSNRVLLTISICEGGNFPVLYFESEFLKFLFKLGAEVEIISQVL